MSQPRISVYASLANGNALPSRVIQGAKTLQARTSHYIAVDAVHDELAVPNPFAQAILFFRGGANGNESPIRIIQGPKTLLNAPDNVAVDPVHREVFTASFPSDSILVFRGDASGDVEPIRILHGPNTKLDRPIRVEVDPTNNVMAVVTDHAILVFNRTDNGDTAPKWIISGPKTGVGTRFSTRDVRLFSEGKKIMQQARSEGALRNEMKRTLRDAVAGNASLGYGSMGTMGTLPHGPFSMRRQSPKYPARAWPLILKVGT